MADTDSTPATTPATPGAAAPDPERSARRRAAHNEKMKKYFKEHPEQAQKKSERVKSRYWSDPEYRERVIQRARLQTAAKRAAREFATATGSTDL